MTSSPASRPTVVRLPQASDSAWPTLAIGSLVGMLACFAASVYGLFTAGAPGWDIAGVTALGAEMGAVSAWSVWASARGRHGQVGAASLVSGIVGCGMVLGPLQASLPLHSDSGSVLSACWFPLVWGVALAANGIRLYWKTYGRLGPA